MESRFTIKDSLRGFPCCIVLPQAQADEGARPSQESKPKSPRTYETIIKLSTNKNTVSCLSFITSLWAFVAIINCSILISLLLKLFADLRDRIGLKLVVCLKPLDIIHKVFAINN